MIDSSPDFYKKAAVRRRFGDHFLQIAVPHATTYNSFDAERDIAARRAGVTGAKTPVVHTPVCR
ncbi:MAG: hypothetical protein IH897_09570 [Planctomycetes bacterium]|nr:hypothetical protein [Planctomycetota bacterium]MCH8242845.1 hypothetical protein [Planctomycetota bacterium]